MTMKCAGCDSTELLQIIDGVPVCPSCKAELEADAADDAAIEEQRVAQGISLWAAMCLRAGLTSEETRALARTMERRVN